jgi:integrase
MTGPTDITPDLWYSYLDGRILGGRSPVTVNIELHELHQFLRFLQEQGRPVCERTLEVAAMKQSKPLPRDVPIDDLRGLLREIDREAHSGSPRIGRGGSFDRAWVLLMLHCGLRTGEIRRLRLCDVDLAARRIRIEQSKGLKDRVVPLSEPSVQALQAHLSLRGPMEGASHVFTCRGKPLSVSYCYSRLRTYGRRCGVEISPHQLRHSCATLLLNAGAPVAMVQRVLGHRHIDTTLRYSRLYDSTVATDYFLAMDDIESRMDLRAGAQPELPFTGGQLLVLVDSLQGGTLSMDQRQTLHVLRSGIVRLVTQEMEVG